MNIRLEQVIDCDMGRLMKLRIRDAVFEFCPDSREIIDICCEKESSPIEALKKEGVIGYDDASRMAVYFLTLAGVLGYDPKGLAAEAEELLRAARERKLE
jgi:hypothetical protein